MDTQGKRLVVIGGGAAGLAAAIAAGERARMLGAPIDISVFERDDRVGRSILATGNGRCNFSNNRIYLDDYHNADFVGEALFALKLVFGQTSDRARKVVRDNGDEVHAFFYQHGLMWRQEGDGRQYPVTNKASTVVDVLRASAAACGVRELCEREVSVVEGPRAPGKPVTMRMADGSIERADAVIVTCGGRALERMDLAGIPLHELRPMLGPLRVADAHLPTVRELDNIRVRCTVSLVRGAREGGKQRVVCKEAGELLFRKYGVSGICVFNLSRHAQPGDELHINLLDGSSVPDAETYLFTRRKMLVERFSNIACADMLRGLVLPRVADAVLAQAGLKERQTFTKADVGALARALCQFTLEIAGIGDPDICQVRRGGLDVGACDARTMAVRDVPGLFVAGEALDVDGPCGGYNLHWAWASGLLAGYSAADMLLEGAC